MANSDEGSVVSEADVNKLAHSLGDLDDMDADLFGDALNKRNNAGNSSGKPITPRRNTPRSKMTKSPTRMQSPTRNEVSGSPPGSARTNLKRKPVKPPSPSAVPSNPLVFSPRLAQPEHKPGTAPGKMTDLSLASEGLMPGQKIHQRPETAPKVKKKYDFGDFDPDDPLAGLLSGSDDISESDRPTSATKNSTVALASQPKVPEDGTLSGKKPSSHVQPDSPRKRNLMERPPTRSGSSLGDNGSPAAANAPDADSSSGQTAIKTQAGIFSDSDDLLDGLGLEEKNVTPAKKNDTSQKVKSGDEDIRPARSAFDSLLGKGSSAASQLLERKEKKEFVLDKKYSTSRDGSAGGQDDENGFQFGSYQPSAASGSRPNSRRSVRFQDDDDIFGLESHPSSGTRKAPPDMEWLETETKSSTPAATKTASAQQLPVTTTSLERSVPPPTSQPTSTFTSEKTSENPSKSIAVDKIDSKVADSNIAKVSSSAGAWLGLADSESDDELFKPKKSQARSAVLPQSPAVSSASASPRTFPKKPTKKNPTSSKLSPTISPSPQANDDGDDDWLARARNRRQQMLSKEEGKGEESDKLISSLEIERGAGGQAMKVDFADLIIDSPNFGGTSRKVDVINDLFSLPQAQPPRVSDWETSKTAPTVNVSGVQTLGHPTVSHSSQPASKFDTRLQFSSATFEQDQQQPLLRQQHQPLPQQQQYQPSQQQQLLHQSQQQHHQFLPSKFSVVQEEKKPQLTTHQTLQQPVLQAGDQLHFSDTVMPTYSQISSTIKLPDSLPEAQAVIRKLELEKTYTESLLESTRRRYEEEMLAVETSYKNRLQIIEDSNRKRETRLREENEQLMQQHLTKLRQVEQEKSDLSTTNYRRLEELEIHRAEDLEKLREQQRLALATMKREHEEALERLASAKNQEINMVANANDTSKSLTAVVQQIQNNARDLGDLQVKIESWNRQGLDEREISLRSKDEQLRILQERLNRQAEDNDRERAKLEDMIAHMEAQLRDQTRTLEEVGALKLKQDQSRVETQQRSLDDERRQWLEQQTRDKINMERSRDSFLEEQSRSMAQINEERRTLMDERTKIQVEQKTFRDKVHQDAFKRTQAETEYESLMRTITEEKAYQITRRQELQRDEEKVSSERNKLEREKNKLEQDQDRLATQAHQIREQSEQIDHLTEAARHTQQEGMQAQEEASQYRAHIEKREAEVQKQLNGFKLMEDHISQEKLRLAKEKKEVENLKNSSLCSNCRSPVHGNNVPHQNGYSSPQLPTSRLPPVSVAHLSASANHLSTSPLDHIAFSIANDRAVRMLKIQAIKDKEFLQEESMYLEGLRHMPYHSTASKS